MCGDSPSVRLYRAVSRSERIGSGAEGGVRAQAGCNGRQAARQSGRPRKSHRSRRRRLPLGCRCRPPPAMVHAGPAARAPSRAMFAAAESKPRRAVSPLGIPKSPSFHSGLDLVANQTTKRSESVSDVARAFRFALFGAGMEGQGPQKAASPPGARTSPPVAAASPDRPPVPNTDKESLMVQLPPLKGSSALAIRQHIVRINHSPWTARNYTYVYNSAFNCLRYPPAKRPLLFRDHRHAINSNGVRNPSVDSFVYGNEV